MALPINTAKSEKVAGFSSFGEQLQAIIRSANPATSPDPRLLALQQRGIPAGGGEQVPADGGFLVAPEFSREILRRVYLTGEILSRCFQFPITQPNRNAIRIPQFNESSRADGSRLGGVQGYWENEADTLLATKPAFGNIELVARKITGLVYLTDELLQDTDALDAWMTYALAEEIKFQLERAIVNGTGDGQPLGVMQSGALVTVAKETGQAAGTVTAANIQKMMSALWAASYNSTGVVWLYNQGLLQNLASLQTVVGTAGSESKLFQWANSVQEYDLLGGFPCLMSEACQAPGTTGDIILCDLSRYIVATRGAVRNEISLHLRFSTDEAAFRAILRVNGVPIDAQPVTPLFGTTKTSPFVALAAR